MPNNSHENKITVQGLLQTPHFKRAKIIAGHAGLTRPVKWIHILDAQIFSALTGNEFILSTGSVFTDLENGVSFLKHLIEHKVSGLCIELVSYITSIPDEMIEIAEQNDFPLVVFNEAVSFIDITLDLHTAIITQNAVSFSRMEKYLKQLNAILLSPHDTEDILENVHTFLGVNVAYVPLSGKPFFIPFLSSAGQKKYLTMFRGLASTEETGHGLQAVRDGIFVAGRPIAASDRKLGDIFIFSAAEEISDFEILVLEKAASAIAQDMLRELFVKEKRYSEENLWVKEWLAGRLKDRDIVQRLDGYVDLSRISGYVACILEFSSKTSPIDSFNQFMIHTTIFMRPLFEQEGFYIIGAYENNKLIYVVLDNEARETWKKRMSRVLKQFNSRRDSLPKECHVTVGVGRMYRQMTHISKSYQTAQEAISIQKTMKREEPFYGSLHIFHLIYLMDQAGNLEEYITDYLSPVIQYDNDHHADLMKTLQVYFACNGSKQKTAERLFIVRQTLYLRIEKLEELLGEDFMQPEKRLAIEFALYAYQFFRSNTVSLK